MYVYMHVFHLSKSLVPFEWRSTGLSRCEGLILVSNPMIIGDCFADCICHFFLVFFDKKGLVGL